MHLVDGVAHLALEPIQAAVHAPQLVLEAQHLLDSCKIETELARQLLNQPEPLDVGLGVKTCVPRGALRPDESLALVDAQGLRVHADEVGRNGDHVARTFVHHVTSSNSGRSERGCSPSSSVKPYSLASSATT